MNIRQLNGRVATVLAFAWTPSVFAGTGAVWTVAQDGSGDFTTIQGAVDEAGVGDSIVVTAGTYTDDDGDGAVVWLNEGSELGILASGEVIIDGQSNARGMYANGVALLVDGIDFVDCVATTGSGGGIFAGTNGSVVQVYQCTFTRCAATEEFTKGGGITFYGSAASPIEFWISECEFNSCAASTYGGAIHSSYASGIIELSTFTGNTASHGGAIEQRVGTCDFNQCDFIGNSALTDGGAMRLYNTDGFFLMTSCTFSGNSAGFGSVLARSKGDVIMESCIIEDNTSTYRGALYLQGNDELATMEILDCKFSGNIGVGSGDGGSDSCIGGIDELSLVIGGTTFCDHGADTEIVLPLPYTDSGGNDLGNWCCPGDVNQDGDVDGDDLSDLITAFGDASMGADNREDAERDGDVDVIDLIRLLSNWGTCPV